MKDKLVVVGDKTLADIMVECINSIPESVDLVYNYCAIQTVNGTMNMRIDEVFDGGYEAEGVYYPFTPFKAVNIIDYDMLAKNEKKIMKRIKEQEKLALKNVN